MEIYAQDLALEGKQLATINEYMMADRCVGSLFEGLNPGQKIFLAEGVFVLDEDLDPVLIQNNVNQFKVEDAFLCFKQYRGGSRISPIGDEFYPSEYPEGKDCFWNSHAQAWRWHPIYGNPCSYLMDVVMETRNLYLVEKLEEFPGLQISQEQAQDLLQKYIPVFLEPSQKRVFNDKSSRSREDRLRGCIEWGYGLSHDRKPWLCVHNYVCYNNPSLKHRK